VNIKIHRPRIFPKTGLRKGGGGGGGGEGGGVWGGGGGGGWGGGGDRGVAKQDPVSANTSADLRPPRRNFHAY